MLLSKIQHARAHLLLSSDLCQHRHSSWTRYDHHYHCQVGQDKEDLKQGQHEIITHCLSFLVQDEGRVPQCGAVVIECPLTCVVEHWWCPNCWAFVIGGEEGCGNNLSPESACASLLGLERRAREAPEEKRRGQRVWDSLAPSWNLPLPIFKFHLLFESHCVKNMMVNNHGHEGVETISSVVKFFKLAVI